MATSGGVMEELINYPKGLQRIENELKLSVDFQNRSNLDKDDDEEHSFNEKKKKNKFVPKNVKTIRDDLLFDQKTNQFYEKVFGKEYPLKSSFSSGNVKTGIMEELQGKFNEDTFGFKTRRQFIHRRWRQLPKELKSNIRKTSLKIPVAAPKDNVSAEPNNSRSLIQKILSIWRNEWNLSGIWEEATKMSILHLLKDIHTINQIRGLILASKLTEHLVKDNSYEKILDESHLKDDIKKNFNLNRSLIPSDLFEEVKSLLYASDEKVCLAAAITLTAFHYFDDKSSSILERSQTHNSTVANLLLYFGRINELIIDQFIVAYFNVETEHERNIFIDIINRITYSTIMENGVQQRAIKLMNSSITKQSLIIHRLLQTISKPLNSHLKCKLIDNVRFSKGFFTTQLKTVAIETLLKCGHKQDLLNIISDDLEDAISMADTRNRNEIVENLLKEIQIIGFANETIEEQMSICLGFGDDSLQILVLNVCRCIGLKNEDISKVCQNILQSSFSHTEQAILAIMDYIMEIEEVYKFINELKTIASLENRKLLRQNACEALSTYIVTHPQLNHMHTAAKIERFLQERYKAEPSYSVSKKLEKILNELNIKIEAWSQETTELSKSTINQFLEDERHGKIMKTASLYFMKKSLPHRID
ncbi:hypothetical protein SNEBB_005384 [Seison nebaliae]|nr:hypothetical protein SNEBB_005384 [Seison nebaliae]